MFDDFSIAGYLPNYGAGHSGEGGGYYNSTSKSYIRGAAYDNYKEPSVAGSGGDTTYGGGVLKIEASGTVEIDGEIKAEYDWILQTFYCFMKKKQDIFLLIVVIDSRCTVQQVSFYACNQMMRDVELCLFTILT